MPENPLYFENELLKLVSTGDEHAFKQLFHLHKKKVYSVALRITKSITSAEELLQDIFLIIWLKRDHLPEIDDFQSYLFIVARNEAYRTLRRNALETKRSRDIRTNAEIPIFQEETEAAISLKDYQARLQRAIDKLPAQQKQVYTLIKEQGLSRDEAAAALNIHPETVKTHLAKAVKTIRAYCQADFELALLVAFTVQGIC